MSEELAVVKAEVVAPVSDINSLKKRDPVDEAIDKAQLINDDMRGRRLKMIDRLGVIIDQMEITGEESGAVLEAKAEFLGIYDKMLGEQEKSANASAKLAMSKRSADDESNVAEIVATALQKIRIGDPGAFRPMPVAQGDLDDAKIKLQDRFREEGLTVTDAEKEQKTSMFDPNYVPEEKDKKDEPDLSQFKDEEK